MTTALIALALFSLAVAVGFVHEPRHACPRSHEIAARLLLPLAIAYDVHVLGVRS